jgi:xanthine dehydrogenase molybdenum-binding subunit
MAYELIGKDFIPPDIRGKVTGRAKYAEDFRAEGMLFAKLLTSPMPHARVRNIDTSAALALDGVFAILTADDIPSSQMPAMPATPILTNEPSYVGEPILAVAAIDETTAHDAIDLIELDLEPLPFTVDPLDSLYPGGPNARSDGNVASRRIETQTIKWTAQDFADVEEGQLPMGQAITEWAYGDVEAGFEQAAVIVDESFVTAGLSHHCMEPRSSMAYWENGKCFLHGSSQSQASMIPGLLRLLNLEQENLVYIAETCGGGFGSKGGPYPTMAIPALLSQQTGRPVMLRITRAEEYGLGTARPGFQGRLKMGFRADGRLLATDLSIINENGPHTGWTDNDSAADSISILYQPVAMRYRGIPVETNTPPRGPQRGPGQNQIAQAIEPLLNKAATELGIDQLTIRRINAADNDAKIGANQGPLTSAYQDETLVQGAELFNWEERSARSGQRNGSKVSGIGIGQSYHSAGRNSYDGLVRITPDGKLHIHTGVGNLGTYSHTATSRVAAEVLKYSWDNCIVVRGDSRRHLSWAPTQTGSNTSFTCTRTAYVAAVDALEKLKEIAAMDLGGSADDYDITDETVFLKSDPSTNITFAAAAQRAIELGGKYSGHEAPEDIHAVTRMSVAGLAGTGLIGVAKDNLRHEGVAPAIATGFIEIELDLETGKFDIIEYVAVADCGTVLHPMGLSNQVKGGTVMGLGMACSERHIYDSQSGLPANVGFYQAKPMSYLDVPSTMQWGAVNIADPQNPVGARGVGEPVQGCASAAILCAISDALGGYYFNRAPITPDMIVNAAAGRSQSHLPLAVNTA